MTELGIYAFIILPIVVAALGWGAAALHNWDMKRHHNTPAE